MNMEEESWLNTQEKPEKGALLVLQVILEGTLNQKSSHVKYVVHRVGPRTVPLQFYMSYKSKLSGVTVLDISFHRI